VKIQGKIMFFEIPEKKRKFRAEYKSEARVLSALPLIIPPRHMFLLEALNGIICDTSDLNNCLPTKSKLEKGHCLQHVTSKLKE
jgi:hypothetical protein